MEEIVYGMNKFKEYFKYFSDKYIIVGGTATAVYLKEQALTARVTKDIGYDVFTGGALSKETTIALIKKEYDI